MRSLFIERPRGAVFPEHMRSVLSTNLLTCNFFPEYMRSIFEKPRLSDFFPEHVQSLFTGFRVSLREFSI